MKNFLFHFIYFEKRAPGLTICVFVFLLLIYNFLTFIPRTVPVNSYCCKNQWNLLYEYQHMWIKKKNNFFPVPKYFFIYFIIQQKFLGLYVLPFRQTILKEFFILRVYFLSTRTCETRNNVICRTMFWRFIMPC